MSYSALLKDPRWQRKRLEILERSDFSCEECEATDRTLHVHHKLYRKGANPWEYDDNELEALCEKCHEQEHSIRKQLTECMAQMSQTGLVELLGFAQGRLLLDGSIGPVTAIDHEHVHAMILAAGRPDYMVTENLIQACHKAGGVITNADLYSVSNSETH